jgi:23S rRNA pseudouridine2605 synthase
MTERRETGQGPARKSAKKRDANGNRPPKHGRPHKQKGHTRKHKANNAPDWSEGERIAKYLARCGVASRRACETLIEEGKISVDGVRIKTPAFKVTGRELIKYGKKIVSQPEPTRLWRYHKPAGLLTTNSDPDGRSTIFQELPKSLPRTITIGRLDYNTEGLLLLTNDGGLARALELPSNAFARTYRARAHGRITQEKLDTLKDGIVVDGEKFGEIIATLERQTGANSWIIVTLAEGKKREVRRALEHLEMKVNRLIRVSYGPFELRDLRPGQVAEINPDVLHEELGHLIPKHDQSEMRVNTGSAPRSRFSDKKKSDRYNDRKRDRPPKTEKRH